MLISRLFHPVVRAHGRLGAGKRFYLRLGNLPSGGCSRNRVTGAAERGVSCYEAFVAAGTIFILGDELKLEATRVKLGHSRRRKAPLHRLSGRRTGTGSDGEPVIAVDQVRPLPNIRVGAIRVVRRRGTGRRTEVRLQAR